MFSTLKGIFILAAIGVPVLGIAGLYCLLFCKGETHYRYLFRTAVVFLSSAALLIGGGFLLERFGLAWRSGPSAILFSVMMVSGWVGLIFIMFCLLPRQWPMVGVVIRRIVKGGLLFFTVLNLLIVLWLGPLVLLFTWGDRDRVIKYQGQTLVEVDDGFMDPHWSYYVYRGPLFRGSERLYDRYEPLEHG